MRTKSIALVVCMLLCLAACNTKQTVVETSYEALAVTAATYNMVMSTAADLHRQGKLDTESYQKIVVAGETCYNAYQLACTTLLLYYNKKNNTSTELEQTTNEIINTMKLQLSELLSTAQNFGITVLGTGTAQHVSANGTITTYQEISTDEVK